MAVQAYRNPSLNKSSIFEQDHVARLALALGKIKQTGLKSHGEWLLLLIWDTPCTYVATNANFASRAVYGARIIAQS